jgi:hypothetical protein
MDKSMATDIRQLANDEKFFVDALLFNVHMRRNLGTLPRFAVDNLCRMADRSTDHLIEKWAAGPAFFTYASKAVNDTCDAIATTLINHAAYLQRYENLPTPMKPAADDHLQTCFAAAERVEKLEYDLRDIFGVRRPANDIEKLALDHLHLKRSELSKEIVPPKPVFLDRFAAAREIIFFRTKTIADVTHATPLDVEIFEIDQFISRLGAMGDSSDLGLASLKRKLDKAAALYATEVDKANGIVATDEERPPMFQRSAETNALLLSNSFPSLSSRMKL